MGWTRGLPRIRGDRPLYGERIFVDRQAPPHPRGSTCPGGVHGGIGRGSPASAGIDPTAFRIVPA